MVEATHAGAPVPREIALYVHWPWCVRKCPYCDFNSFACSGEDAQAAHSSGAALRDEAVYIDALLLDLDAAVALSGPRTVASIFFGGGTPSLMSSAGFARLMQGIRARLPLAPDCEITMEANPGTVEQARFEDYAASGVNRFSIGVQSFNDRFLKALGRIHTGLEAERAVEAALHCVENVNLDVMYALPGQTLEDVRRDVDAALCAGTTHLSFYELTIEEGTAFAKRPPAGLPDIDLAADMGDLVQESLTRDGFEHYEISGYARPGRRCRHNLAYWTFGDYYGIGAGAHGKVTVAGGILRTVRRQAPFLYMDDVRSGRIVGQLHDVDAQSLPFEFMLNALRLFEGVPASRWQETTGLPLSVIEPVLEDLRAEGLVVNDPDRIAVTELGRRFLSDVQERFLSGDERR